MSSQKKTIDYDLQRQFMRLWTGEGIEERDEPEGSQYSVDSILALWKAEAKAREVKDDQGK